MTTRYRVGLIGVGSISQWHVRAIRAAGMELGGVGARPGSTRLHAFAGRHAIETVFDDWRDMMDKRHQWDALVIATSPDGTPAVMIESLALDIPLLVEKPVAWRRSSLDTLPPSADARTLVGYNRRFYGPVQRARLEAQNGPPLLAQVTLPDSVEDPGDDATNNAYLRTFFDNSSHGLDMARFVLGPLRLVTVERVAGPGGRLAGLAALLRSERGDVVQLTCNWATPANFCLALYRPGRRVDLLPFEIGTVYEGMDVLEPTDECPIRRYVPKQVERVMLDRIDQVEKPGFVAQAEALKGMIEGRPLPPCAARLADAAAALELCEALVGGQLA